MTSNNPFLNWLHGAECKPGPVNSYYYALFSEKLRGILAQTNESCFLRDCFENIRDSDILAELEHEKKVNGVSPLLRELLINLLKLAHPGRDIKSDNFMEEMRGFVISLYSGKIEKKILPNKPFYQFPAELKLWIICALIQYNSEEMIIPSTKSRNTVPNHPLPIGRDSTGNLYFIVNDNLLYVQYGTQLQEMTRTEEDFKLSTCERTIISMPRWKLLADSEVLLRRITILLESFDEVDIANRIEEALEESESRRVTEEEKEQDEKEDADQFQRGFSSRRSRTQLKKPPSIDSDEEQRYSPSHDNLDRLRESETSSPVVSQGDEHPLNPQRAKTIRCMYFPHCRRKDEECFFVHPRIKCKNFLTGKCPGMYCRFLHEKCPKDGNCMDNECPYEHDVTMPSIRRSPYSKTKENPQGSQSTGDGGNINRSSATGPQQPIRKTRDEAEEKLNINGREQWRNRDPSPPKRVVEPERTLLSPVHNERPFSNKELRCHYFPRCNKPADRCFYAHPRDHCAAFPNCMRGRDCPFLHGPCKKDGRCVDEHCQFEHYQQIPPRASIAYQRHLQSKRD